MFINRNLVMKNSIFNKFSFFACLLMVFCVAASSDEASNSTQENIQFNKVYETGSREYHTNPMREQKKFVANNATQGTSPKKIVVNEGLHTEVIRYPAGRTIKLTTNPLTSEVTSREVRDNGILVPSESWGLSQSIIVPQAQSPIQAKNQLIDLSQAQQTKLPVTEAQQNQNTTQNYDLDVKDNLYLEYPSDHRDVYNLHDETSKIYDVLPSVSYLPASTDKRSIQFADTYPQEEYVRDENPMKKTTDLVVYKPRDVVVYDPAQKIQQSFEASQPFTLFEPKSQVTTFKTMRTGPLGQGSIAQISYTQPQVAAMQKTLGVDVHVYEVEALQAKAHQAQLVQSKNLQPKDAQLHRAERASHGL